MSWNWHESPKYSSAGLVVDARRGPLVVTRFVSPKHVTDEEINTLYEVYGERVELREPTIFVADMLSTNLLLTGVQRTIQAKWLSERRDQLQGLTKASVVLIARPVHRAAMRLVFGLRPPPIRVITVGDREEACQAILAELVRWELPVTPLVEEQLGAVRDDV